MSVASLFEVQKKLPILAYIWLYIKIRFHIQFSVTLKKVTSEQIMILITNVICSANFTFFAHLMVYHPIVQSQLGADGYLIILE